MDSEVIKTPVRFDPKGDCIREDDMGRVIALLPGAFAIGVDAEMQLQERNERLGTFIALCINSHAEQQSEIAALKQQVEKLKKALDYTIEVLRTYERGNREPDLAERAADVAQAVLNHQPTVPSEKDEVSNTGAS